MILQNKSGKLCDDFGTLVREEFRVDTVLYWNNE